jgi:DNA-binding transcriptional LysR family regulator
MPDRRRFKDLQLAQLRSFCLAAAAGNFTAAAAELGLSVSAVWLQVRALERVLGATLLRRKGRAVEVTPDGRLLLELVGPHVGALDSLPRLFQARRADLPQTVSIASSHYLLTCHLDVPIREFTRRRPQVRIKLHIGRLIGDAVRMVERGGADVCVAAFQPGETLSPHLEFEHLFGLHLALMTAKNHPLARARRVTIQDVARYPLIMAQEGTYAHTAAVGLLRRHNLADKAHIVMESGNVDMIRQYAAMGLGVALAYVGAEGTRTSGPAIRPFDTKLPKLTVAMGLRRHAHRPPAVEEFCEAVRRHCRD